MNHSTFKHLMVCPEDALAESSNEIWLWTSKGDNLEL